jgi:hypothetical protein
MLLMSRKKDRELWQHRFNLSSDDPGQAKLHEYLDKLAENNEASEWIVKTLIAALPAMTKQQLGRLFSTLAVKNGRASDEPHYEPVDE